MVTVGVEQASAQETGWKSDVLERTNRNGVDIRILKGNVVLTQPDKVLYCDSAYEYLLSKDVVFMGNVRLVQNTGEVMTGDTLFYKKSTRIATMKGRQVLLESKNSRLTSTELDYNMETAMVNYRKGATIQDGKTTLISQQGDYDRAKGIFYFRKDVVVTGEKSSLVTDSLNYHQADKMAYFFGPSKVMSEDGTIISTKGRYNTETEIAFLEGRSFVDAKDYTMTADLLDFDKVKDKGVGKGNVIIFSKKDSTIISGDQGFYDGFKGISKVWDKPLLRSPVDEVMTPNGIRKDTLYLRGDTLVAFGSQKLPNLKQRVLAWPKAQVFKQNLQAIADSLVYEISDSLLWLYKDPVVWSGKNQITADTIKAVSRSQKLDKVYIRKDAFVISIDTLGNYNQTKGRNMLAHFRSGRINRIDVDGNGQSIYWVLDGDTVSSGMNRIVCSDMIIRLNEQGKLSKLTFIKEPDAVFTPPHELKEPEKKLKGFKWRNAERPTLLVMIGRERDIDLLVPKVQPTNSPKPKSAPKNKQNLPGKAKKIVTSPKKSIKSKAARSLQPKLTPGLIQPIPIMPGGQFALPTKP